MSKIDRLLQLCGDDQYLGEEYAMPSEVKNGLLGTMVAWINEYAYSPQPTLAMANALAFGGALLGQRVTDSYDTRTNIMTMGISKSCSGKDHSRKLTRKLAEAAGAGHLIAGDDVTSDAAVLRVTKAATGRGVLFQFDEIGDRIVSIKSKNASTTEASILSCLTKLFTSSNSVYGGKEYADDTQRETSKIINPCACMYGTGTPSGFWPHINTPDINNGFLGRVLIFPGLPKALGTMVRLRQDQELVESVAAWSDYRFAHAADSSKPMGNIEAAVAANSSLMEAVRSEGAESVIDMAENTFHDWYTFAEDDGDGLEALYGRALEMVNKIALIASAPLTPPAPGEAYVIEKAVAEWAVRLVKCIVEMTAAECRRSVADTQAERDYKSILAAIDDAGRLGITQSELTRKVRTIKAKDRNEFLKSMHDGEEIVIDFEASNSGPRTKRIWRTHHHRNRS